MSDRRLRTRLESSRQVYVCVRQKQAAIGQKRASRRYCDLAIYATMNELEVVAVFCGKILPIHLQHAPGGPRQRDLRSSYRRPASHVPPLELEIDSLTALDQVASAPAR